MSIINTVRNDEQTRKAYNQYKNYFSQKIAEAKRNYNTKKITTSSNKSETIWNIVNTEMKKKEDNESSNMQASDFNKAFVSAVQYPTHTTTNGKTYTDFLQSENANNANSIYFPPVTEAEIERTITNLKSKKTEDIYLCIKNHKRSNYRISRNANK